MHAQRTTSYLGVFIYPTAEDEAGTRWLAYYETSVLRAATLAGMRELIRQRAGLNADPIAQAHERLLYS